MERNNFRGISDRDVTRISQNLQQNFREATRHMAANGRSAKKGTDLYMMQVDFCYMLHDFQTTFKHNRSRLLSGINDFISSIQPA